ncbi:MAG TPA: gliding motility-associated C-terminal domain-containing protein, partial [Chitinophagales bacterium]|nr:gliding motility-associated C-terminal domain-containing protein [Chitinophagales bacterium]
PPFVYQWSDNSTNQDLIDVAGGTYYVTVTDDSGCRVIDSAVVNEPATITSYITATSVSCSTGADADIDLTVSGGTPPYDFFWSNFAFTEDQTDVPAGTYTVLITDDNDCQHSDRVTIAAAPGLTATLNISDVTCFGANDGQVEVIVNGGIPPYNYDWSNNQTTPIITGLGPGIYDVTVTDSIACSGNFSALVEEPEKLEVQTSASGVLCHGDNTGIAIPFVTGGTGTYNFLWNTNPPSTNPAQTGLRGGTYLLEVRDENDCPAVDTVIISEPSPLSVAVLGTENILCLNGDEGEVTVSASGGVAPYQYSVHANLFQNDSVFTGLEAGDYGVMVLDDNGCMATASFTLTESAGFSVNLPAYIFIALGASDTLKPDIVSPFPIANYAWTPGDYLSCDDCREPVVTPAQDISYTLAVSDSNGCVVTDEITVVVKTEYEVFMPNVFSPNGDGNNDVYVPIDFGGVREGTMKIFNRWGSLVYKTDDFNAGWDGTFNGKELMPGVFIYHISGVFLDGNTFDATGSLTLVK